MYIEVIKWNWHIGDGVRALKLPNESVYYYDTLKEAQDAYDKDVEHLIETDATIYLANVIDMKAR